MTRAMGNGMCILCCLAAGIAAAEVTTVDMPPTTGRNATYGGNRAPLRAAPFIKLPIRAIEPRGWLRKQLELQATGFHGHLGEISRFLIKENNAWLSPAGEGDHGWEEPPYWLKGYANCAFLLRDEAMLRETQVWIEAALNSRKDDGWFGPDKGRTGLAAGDLTGRDDLWPNMIMLFCLQDYYDFTGDGRVLDLMKAYFGYLAQVPEDRFLAGYWPKMRGGDLLYSVYWLYNLTGDEALLPFAEKVHRHTARWDEDVINWHNVNMAQGFGEGATYWLQSADPADLASAYRNYDKMRELYGQVPGGMYGSDENCRAGYDDPRQAVETCGMVEMMLSLETLTWMSGDLLWADRCEDVAFNSLPAALTPDMRALRYLTSPNMVVSDRTNKAPGIQNGGPMFLMDPHDHRCCQHNWGHGWPYYAEHLWFATPDNGLAAVFYADSAVSAKVGTAGADVTVTQSTRYPFEDTVEFTVGTQADVEFPLYLRVPGWCTDASLTVNGQAVTAGADPRSCYRIERSWRNGDRVSLRLPMAVKLRTWEKNHGSVSVDRGPLTYSLRIEEETVKAIDRGGWDAFEIYPRSPWNYALVLDGANPAGAMEVVTRPWPETDMPFTLEGTPIELRAKARRVPEWRLDRFGLCAELQDSPVRTDEPVETVALVPMGAARLRISSFPVAGTVEGANAWVPAPGPPEPLPYSPTASHCWQNDTVEAMCDQLEPRNSGDHEIPRMTWWDRRGTEEWVQYTFEEPRSLSSVSVYWFDDTGGGACRVPASWKLQYLDGGAWREVETADPYGTAKDTFNTVTFKAVTTDALRIVVQLDANVSGGILEWRVAE